MNNHYASIEHYRGREDFIKRVYDWIDQCERQNRIITTPFFSLEEQKIVESICGKNVRYLSDGGYAGCERKRYAFLPFACDVKIDIAILKATYSTTFANITHRDVLGAFMNLGLKREQLGDIVVQNQVIYLFVASDLVNYICCNLTKIKRTHVHFFQCKEQVVKESNTITKHYIVASLRLDVLVAAFACVSRNKANELIRSGRVKVNHVILEESSFVCNNNSAISIRGFGRYQFEKVIKMTKKNHYVIEVAQFE